MNNIFTSQLINLSYLELAKPQIPLWFRDFTPCWPRLGKFAHKYLCYFKHHIIWKEAASKKYSYKFVFTSNTFICMFGFWIYKSGMYNHLLFTIWPNKHLVARAPMTWSTFTMIPTPFFIVLWNDMWYRDVGAKLFTYKCSLSLSVRRYLWL